MPLDPVASINHPVRGNQPGCSYLCLSHTHSPFHLWVSLSKPCVSGWTWKLGHPSLSPAPVSPQLSCNKPWYADLMATTVTICEAPTRSQSQRCCSRAERPRLQFGTQPGLLENIAENIQYLHCAKLMTNTLRIFLLPICYCLFLAGKTGSRNIPSAENLRREMLICWQGSHTRQAEGFWHMVHIWGQIASNVLMVQRRGKASASCVRRETDKSHTSRSACWWTGWFEWCWAQLTSGEAGARG